MHKQQFAQQMEYLKNTYNVVSLPVMLKEIFWERKTPHKQVAITFDDGYANNYSVAYPILKAMSLPATFFITTSFIEQPNNSLWFNSIYDAIHCFSGAELNLMEIGLGIINVKTDEDKSAAISMIKERLKKTDPRKRKNMVDMIFDTVRKNDCIKVLSPGMSWTQIEEIASDPLMTIGGHSHTHDLLDDLTEDQAWEEIITNKRLLESHIGKEIETFSYPNGNWNPTVSSLLERAGYNFALTTQEGFVGANPVALERFTVRNPSTSYSFMALVSGVILLGKRII